MVFVLGPRFVMWLGVLSVLEIILLRKRELVYIVVVGFSCRILTDADKHKGLQPCDILLTLFDMTSAHVHYCIDLTLCILETLILVQWQTMDTKI